MTLSPNGRFITLTDHLEGHPLMIRISSIDAVAKISEEKTEVFVEGTPVEVSESFEDIKSALDIIGV